jgi:hypothetical protein
LVNVQTILKRAAELKRTRKPREHFPVGGGSKLEAGKKSGNGGSIDPVLTGGGDPKRRRSDDQPRPPVAAPGGASGGISAPPVGAAAKESSDEHRYTLSEALAIFTKGAKLAIVEKEAEVGNSVSFALGLVDPYAGRELELFAKGAALAVTKLEADLGKQAQDQASSPGSVALCILKVAASLCDSETTGE